MENYNHLLSEYPETVSKEQMYKICHISKRTAQFLLQAGLVPCVNSGKQTRNYKIKMVDIIAYLKARKKNPQKYRYTKANAEAVLPPSPEHVQQQREKYTMMLQNYPDVLTTGEVSQITGCGIGTVLKWLKKNKIRAFIICGKYQIPKICLIEFLITPYYHHWHGELKF